MSNLLKAIVYILANYPKLEELSKPRLVKIIYLFDWKHAIDYGSQFTEIDWYFNHYGPYVDDVINTMKYHPSLFEVKSQYNPYGGGMTDKFRLLRRTTVDLPQSAIDSINFVIEKTHHLNWTEFISIVYSSYPVAHSAKYTNFDLASDSRKFRAMREKVS